MRCLTPGCRLRCAVTMFVSSRYPFIDRAGVLRTRVDVGPPLQTDAIAPRSAPRASRQRLPMLLCALVGWRVSPAHAPARAHLLVTPPVRGDETRRWCRPL